MAFVSGLRCTECGSTYGPGPLHVCEECFGPLAVSYEYGKVRGALTREALASRPRTLWRYRELLPIDGEPVTGRDTGFTPLVEARNLARAWGVDRVFLKDDTVSHPTLSFKDRVVAVAVTKARELGFETVACVSTGNLANALAAQAAQAGMRCVLLTPAGIEGAKTVLSQVYRPVLVAVSGNYDEVNRLGSEIADRHRWAFVNINLRPFYVEGSKTVGFEIAEQLGWRAPDAVVVPCASGSLLIKVWQAFQELAEIGLVPAVSARMFAAQAAGCGPIVTAIENGGASIEPVRPRTIARSIAMGDPADGHAVLDVVRRSGGFGASASDDEIVGAVRELAATEGIFAEPAGGVAVAAARKLVAAGRIPRDATLVICITGSGVKATDVVDSSMEQPAVIPPTLRAFEDLLATMA